MDFTTNVLMGIIFAGLGGYLGFQFLKTRNKITIYDKKWNFTKMMLLFFGVFNLLTVFSLRTPLDIFRFLAMTFAIAMFLFLKEGVGEEGIVSSGHFHTYQEISAYDYKDYKKEFHVYFVIGKENKGKETYAIVRFEQEKKESVKKLLDQKIGRKYTRIKK